MSRFFTCIFAVALASVTLGEEVHIESTLDGGITCESKSDFGCEDSSDCCGQAGCGCQTCCASPIWLRTEGLVWWMEGAQVPVLVSTGPAGSNGVIGQGGVPLYGGDRIQDGARFGGRITAGLWLDAFQYDGLELSWMSLGSASEADFLGGPSTGNPLLARPFFNLTTNMEDALRVAATGVVDGAVAVTLDSEMHSATATYRMNWTKGCGMRVDLLGGYRYLRFRDVLSITENLVNRDPSIVLPGTTFNVLDRFAMENDFHGAEFGASAAWDHQCYTIEVLGKLAVGNMRRVSNVDGSTTVTTPGGTPTTAAGGLFALPSNIGFRSDDEIALIPELNVTLDYQVCDCFDLSVGYSLMFITNVLRAGEQIDRVVNTTQLPRGTGPVTGDLRPSAQFNDSTIWVQGLQFGGVFKF